MLADHPNTSSSPPAPRHRTQGGAISYLAGLTSAQPVAGIIGLSTWLPLRSKISSMLQPHSSSTPIFHGHGNADPIVRYEFGQRTVNFVRKDLGAGEFAVSDGKAKGVRFETYNGMPHSACPEEVSWYACEEDERIAHADRSTA